MQQLQTEGPTPAEDPGQGVERAMSDYLAVSRARHLYASDDEHQRAEERAWARLEAARRAG
ncbi:MAG: hypothetical protein MUE51_09745 [Thermoleophilia bacterium]|jgi:hypothetical protein|nr:hypothetical protein [Thermoleophilia bacterium]